MPHDPVMDGLDTFKRPVVPTSFLRGPDRDKVKALENRVLELEKERKEGGVLLKLDPKKVGHSELANRDERSLTPGDSDFDDLLESIRVNGQDTPIIVRPAPPGGSFDYLIVAGHRRHAVCMQLDRERPEGFFVLARLVEDALDPQIHFLRMHRENNERKGLSAFETGLMYRNILAAKKFENQAHLATSIRKSEVTVLKYIQVAELPAEVLLAFSDPRVISLRWSQDLQAALKGNTDAVLDCARQLALRDPAPSAKDVLSALVKAGRDKKESAREETIKIDGHELFTFKYQENGNFNCKFGKSVDKKLRRELAAEFKALAEQRLKERSR